MSEMVCSKCGTLGDPRRHTKGSILIEIVLWLAFIIPGLIYSLWRLTTRANVCRACGSAELVPATSPVGKKLLAEHGMGQPEMPAGSRVASNVGRALGQGVRGMMGRR
jgi:hypothetical protein